MELCEDSFLMQPEHRTVKGEDPKLSVSVQLGYLDIEILSVVLSCAHRNVATTLGGEHLKGSCCSPMGTFYCLSKAKQCCSF